LLPACGTEPAGDTADADADGRVDWRYTCTYDDDCP
jgi:hypothetical protein